MMLTVVITGNAERDRYELQPLMSWSNHLKQPVLAEPGVWTITESSITHRAFDVVDRVAIALKDEAEKFSRPIPYYVNGEAEKRWREANPTSDEDAPYSGADFEDWRILARAAIAALPNQQ